MMSDLVKQLFINPKNVGALGSAEFVGKAGSVRCGATLQFSLSIDESQRVTDAKFKSAGCSYLVAANSLLTEEVKGKTTGEAAALAQHPESSVIERLGEWPADRTHCAVLACEALISAVKAYSDAVREEWQGDEALICTCFGVSERTIEREITARGLRTIAEVTQTCNAGAGCRSCYPLIEDILSQHLRERDLLVPAPG
jgi:NifU-like protein